MPKNSTSTPIIIADVAEGLPTSGEDVEPASPLKTRTMPIINIERKVTSPIADTGIAAAVDVTPEGSSVDDTQDASRTTDETRPATKPDVATEAEAAQERSVLIVEDTTELAEVIQATLERMNLKTAHETHGDKAIAKFNEMSPDLVLLDISLPDMTGWEILDAIKGKNGKSKAGGHSPLIIVITAYGDPANRLVGKLQDIHSYLIKPFTPDDVEKAVRNAFASLGA